MERLEAASEWVVEGADGIPARYAATPEELATLQGVADLDVALHDVEFEPSPPPYTQLLLRKRPGGAYQATQTLPRIHPP